MGMENWGKNRTEKYKGRNDLISLENIKWVSTGHYLTYLTGQVKAGLFPLRYIREIEAQNKGRCLYTTVYHHCSWQQT